MMREGASHRLILVVYILQSFLIHTQQVVCFAGVSSSLSSLHEESTEYSSGEVPATNTPSNLLMEDDVDDS